MRSYEKKSIKSTLSKNITLIHVKVFCLLSSRSCIVSCLTLGSLINFEFIFVYGFRKIANIRWIIEKAREFQKSVYFCFIDYVKAFDCVDHNKLWKILKEMGISDNLTCLLRNLYAGQEATVRTGHGAMDWFQTGKGVSRLYIATLLI